MPTANIVFADLNLLLYISTWCDWKSNAALLQINESGQTLLEDIIRNLEQNPGHSNPWFAAKSITGDLINQLSSVQEPRVVLRRLVSELSYIPEYRMLFKLLYSPKLKVMYRELGFMPPFTALDINQEKRVAALEWLDNTTYVRTSEQNTQTLINEHINFLNGMILGQIPLPQAPQALLTEDEILNLFDELAAEAQAHQEPQEINTQQNQSIVLLDRVDEARKNVRHIIRHLQNRFFALKTQEQNELLNYLFLQDGLYETDLNRAIRYGNPVILGHHLANRLNRSAWRDSLDVNLKFRQGLMVAVISSVLNFGLIFGLVAVIEYFCLPLYVSMVWLIMLIKNIAILNILNLEMFGPERQVGMLSFYYSLIASPVISFIIPSLFCFDYLKQVTWTVLLNVFFWTGLVDGAGLVGSLGLMGLPDDNTMQTYYGTWIDNALLSVPGKLITGLLAQPLLFLAAFGLMAGFVCYQIVRVTLEAILHSVNPIVLWFNSTPDWWQEKIHAFSEHNMFIDSQFAMAVDFLRMLWWESVGVRTVTWKNDIEASLNEAPQLTGMMEHARAIAMLETNHARALTPKEQLTHLLRQYLNQDAVISFFRKAKPEENLVNNMLRKLNDDDHSTECVDTTVSKISRLLLRTNNVELISIGNYTKYVLIPMEQKQMYQANVEASASLPMSAF